MLLRGALMRGHRGANAEGLGHPCWDQGRHAGGGPSTAAQHTCTPAKANHAGDGDRGLAPRRSLLSSCPSLLDTAPTLTLPTPTPTPHLSPYYPDQLKLGPVDLGGARMDVALTSRWPRLACLDLHDRSSQENNVAAILSNVDGAEVEAGGPNSSPADTLRLLRGLLDGFILPR
jgi:hypothetical protein